MADGVEVKGADRVAATLHAAAQRIENLDQADRRVAAQLAQAARARAPKRSGALARSTAGIPSPEGGARVQATVIYAGVIHNGWRRHNISPNPFIRDAVEAGVPAAANTYAQECQQALNTVRGA